jgi:predicted anti-sigma-YlaC factor YlaD
MKVILTSRIGCSEVRKLADAYLDDELSVETKRRVLEHTRSCEACRDWISASARLKHRVQNAVRRLEIPAHFRRELRAALGW